MRLIDATKLRKAIKSLPNCCNGFSDTYDKACIIGVIDDQPTIDPVAHGRWVNDNGLYKCSVCNMFTITGWANCIPIDQMNITMRYCPNCGAKMDDRLNVKMIRKENSNGQAESNID